MRCKIKPTIIIAFLIAAFSVELAAAEDPTFDYKFLSETDLAMSIGDSLFNAPSDGCWTCHGSDGNGITTPTDQSQIKSNIKLAFKDHKYNYNFLTSLSSYFYNNIKFPKHL